MKKNKVRIQTQRKRDAKSKSKKERQVRFNIEESCDKNLQDGHTVATKILDPENKTKISTSQLGIKLIRKSKLKSAIKKRPKISSKREEFNSNYGMITIF